MKCEPDKFSNQTEQAARALQPVPLRISRWTKGPELSPLDQETMIWTLASSSVGWVREEKYLHTNILVA